MSSRGFLTEQDFLEMWSIKGDAIAQGSFGKIYIVDFNGQQYALKQMKSDFEEMIENDIQGNNMLLSGIKKLNKENSFYKH